MAYPTPYHRLRLREQTGRLLVLWITLILLASVVDRPAYHLLTMDKAAVEWRGWYQVLRQMGYAPTWLIVALAASLHAGWIRRRDQSGALAGPPVVPGEGPGLGSGARAKIGAGVLGLPLLLSIAAAGLGAELLKLLVGRERPLADGGYEFKPFLYGFVDGSNLGFPSSHTSVAFGAALVLARVLPGVGWIAIPLAAGCGLTRVLVGAHFLSDVVAGAAIGWASGLWACRIADAGKDRAA